MATEAEKHAAYLEAQEILKMDEKWQELMPGERKPNFRRAAREVIKKALGQKVFRNEQPLDMHEGLMHEHGAREAELIERTLKNGHYDPSFLHSFQLGSKLARHDQIREEQPKTYDDGYDPDLPDIEVQLHHHGTTLDYPSHFEVGAGRLHMQHSSTPTHVEVQVQAPQGTRLPSDYKAVH